MNPGVVSRSVARLALCVAGLCASLAIGRAADPGAAPSAEILRDLRRFRQMATVLHVGAHPDDENTALIAYFARGRGYRTAYLSVTRGDGGQNESGPEFGEKLGVARTQELLAARRLDGGRQFFTRAIDFGYSKSPEETLGFWNRDEVLADVVRVIRTFRPDVIVTRFPIPPGSGGHGHHTASAMLAVEAFKLAGDPQAFPDQIAQGLTPWQPKRIGWNAWSNRGTGELPGPAIQFDIGGSDPVTGIPFATIANQSRGMHKTQMLGGLADRPGSSGPNPQTFLLLAGDPPEHDLFDGIDTTWNRVPGGAAIDEQATRIIADFDSDHPAASVPALLRLRARLVQLASDPIIDEKRRDLDRILQACLGLSLETTLPQAEVVPGETVRLRHWAAVAAAAPVRWLSVRYPATDAVVAVNQALAAGEPAVVDATPVLPANTPPSQPYWLRTEGSAGMFRVDDPQLIGTPENPPAFPVEFIFEVSGQILALSDEPVQVVAGAPAAQERRRLAVIPPVSLAFAHEVELFSPGATKQIAVAITAARAGSAGSLRLAAPAGWTVAPATRPFSLAAVGDRADVSFSVTAPPDAGSATLGATAEIGGAHFGTERCVLSYPHIPVQLLQRPARAKVVCLEARILGRRVGYLPGAGDSTAASIAQLGYEVTTLSGADLQPEKLTGLDAVVLGVRAFNDRDDLAAHLPGLFAWVEAGGTVIAQYNRPNALKAKTLGPYPLSIDGPAPALRVTDENAPVTFLAPDHPVLTTPNRITAADFDGWVQERGAYFPSSWDEHYTPILAMSDPGEAPLRSSLLVARHGRGWFVYTGLSFFRQLPAGHPGAHRLFANLLSLGR